MQMGFALSDHADWSGLLQVVKATGAEGVYYTWLSSAFARYLTEHGIPAQEVKTEYGDTDEELNIPETTPNEQ